MYKCIWLLWKRYIKIRKKREKINMKIAQNREIKKRNKLTNLKKCSDLIQFFALFEAMDWSPSDLNDQTVINILQNGRQMGRIT